MARSLDLALGRRRRGNGKPPFDQAEVAGLRAYTLYRAMPSTNQVGGLRAYALYRAQADTFQVAAVRAYALYRAQ